MPATLNMSAGPWNTSLWTLTTPIAQMGDTNRDSDLPKITQRAEVSLGSRAVQYGGQSLKPWGRKQVHVFLCEQFLLAGIKREEYRSFVNREVLYGGGFNKRDQKLDWIKHLASSSLHPCPYWSAVIEHDRGIDWLKQVSGIWDLKPGPRKAVLYRSLQLGKWSGKGTGHEVIYIYINLSSDIFEAESASFSSPIS